MNIKKNIKRINEDLIYDTKIIKKIKNNNSDNSDNSDIDNNNDENDDNDDNDDNDNFLKSFVIYAPIYFLPNDKNIGDDYKEDDEEEDDKEDDEEYDDEDDEEYDDEDDEEYDDENKDKDDNLTTDLINFKKIKNKEVKYFDSSDSSDSENELDTKNKKKFSINLLTKIKRHIKKNKPKLIAEKFNNQIKKMSEKYNKYSKNPNKFIKLREFKQNIDECENLHNLLIKDIEYYDSKFNFDLFLNKHNYKKSSEKSLEKILTQKQNIINIISKNKSGLDEEFEELYDNGNKTNQTGIKYFKTLDNQNKRVYVEKLKKINKDIDSNDKRPNYMKVLDMEMPESNKSLILQRISQIENSTKYGGDSKLKNWINKIMKVPFGTYVKPPIKKNDSIQVIKKYLDNVRNILDKEIYGHKTTKDQLVKIIAHTITNPNEGGNIFALQGPPGIGKTALIQDGIAKALDKPFSFISLGGATDACFLEGHDFTYEGSNHGRIIEVLQQTKCMNPVIYFDELDKVSDTTKGEEIINILMHITDQTQNSHFNDKYFGGIEFDLSKAIIIFSFNEEHKISRILRDRMKIIRVKGYKMLDKINIARDYLIPKLKKNIGLEDIKINIPDNIIEYLIDNYTQEGGVRKLKELLNDILLEINLRKLEGNNILEKKIKSQITLNEDIIEKDLLKKKNKIIHIKINNEPTIGVVNGLWANDLGIGGLIPIECCWVPASEKLKLELTGMQGDVMKESMSVARSVAWRILPENIKSNLYKKWKNTNEYGIHIHCPDGSTPKDGPSAGGAITTCLISLLTNSKINNQVAMTGEINLKGHITAIGGLEEKIFGAKKAGVTLVLYPKENSKDLDEIIEKFPNLFDDKFRVKMIETIWDILNEVISDRIDWIRFD